MPKAKAKTPKVALPVPSKYDSRICFSIAYFPTEADADRYAAWVRDMGFTYNGGYFHSMPCGREPSRDYVDPVLGKLFAVTE